MIIVAGLLGGIGLIGFAYLEQSDKVEVLERKNEKILADHGAIGATFGQQAKEFEAQAQKFAQQTKKLESAIGSSYRQGFVAGQRVKVGSGCSPASEQVRRSRDPGSSAATARARPAADEDRRRGGRVRGALGQPRLVREPDRAAQRLDAAGAGRRYARRQDRVPPREAVDRPERHHLRLARERDDLRSRRLSPSRAGGTLDHRFDAIVEQDRAGFVRRPAPSH